MSKSNQVMIRVTDAQKRRLQDGAGNAGLSVSAFVLMAALAEADATTLPAGSVSDQEPDDAKVEEPGIVVGYDMKKPPAEADAMFVGTAADKPRTKAQANVETPAAKPALCPRCQRKGKIRDCPQCAEL